MQAETDTVTLYRPVGPKELELLKEGGFRRWPPRLPEQPIFYPVTNEEYAVEIASKWNVAESGCGFVTRFQVRSAFLSRYAVHQVGASRHAEWWIPAEELEELNDNIVGVIEVIHSFGAARLEMRTKIIIIILVLAIAGAGVAWLSSSRNPSPDGFDRTQYSLPSEARKILDAGQRFILLSLDPMDPALRSKSAPAPKETFHDYTVLGQTEIRDERQRADLLRALYKGIADSDGGIAPCFNPRHGISATLGDETVDLVICFECFSIETYTGAGESGLTLTTGSPEATFNGALESARLPTARNPT